MAKIINPECAGLVKQNPLAEKPSPKPFYTVGLHSHTHKLVHVLITAHHAHQSHHLFFLSAPGCPGFMSSHVLPALHLPAGRSLPKSLHTQAGLQPFTDSFGNTATGKGQGGEVPIKIFSHRHRAAQQGQENWSQVDFWVRRFQPCCRWQRFGDRVSRIWLSWWARDRSSPLTYHNTNRTGISHGFEAWGFFSKFLSKFAILPMPCWRKNIGPNGGLCTGFGVRPVNFYFQLKKKIQTLIPFSCLILGFTAANTKSTSPIWNPKPLHHKSIFREISNYISGGIFLFCLSILKTMDYITRKVGINSSCSWNPQGKKSFVLNFKVCSPSSPISPLKYVSRCYSKHILKTFTSQALLL